MLSLAQKQARMRERNRERVKRYCAAEPEKYRAQVRERMRRYRERRKNGKEFLLNGISTQCHAGDHELDCPMLTCHCVCHADEFGYAAN